MQTENLIRNLILLPCPEPSGVAITCEAVAGKLFFVVRPDALNVTRLVGRQGATIQALKALASAIAPNATINLMDAEDITPRAQEAVAPIELLNEVAKRVGFTVSAKNTSAGTVAVLPASLPDTLRLAIQVVFRNANRNPAGALFLQ